MFAKKLEFLMNITGTSNVELAEAVGLDASHVSRLRRGERKLPRHQKFITAMSLYFAEQAVAEYQKNALREALCPGEEWPENLQKAAALIGDYLASPLHEQEHSVNLFLDNLTSYTPPETGDFIPYTDSLPASGETAFYYGKKGKQQAVIRFLQAVLAKDEPQTLLLYSDEEMDWLTDKNFVGTWSYLLMRILQNQNRVKIIHNTSRRSQELLVGISKWLPLYLTGNIEPYYCPQASASPLRRTIFIAPKTAAVMSNSVTNQNADGLNLYLTDPQAVAAAEAEINTYFTLCLPLVRFYTTEKTADLTKILCDFTKKSDTAISAHNSPSLMTMPWQLARSLSKRLQFEELQQNYKKAAAKFKQQLEQGTSITEIIKLPCRRDIDKGRITLPYRSGFYFKNANYLPEEYRAHLNNLIKLMERYDNYKLVFNNNINENILIISREKSGTLIARKNDPTVLMAVYEPNMCEAFWLYLQKLQGKPNKAKTIAQIKKLL